MEKFKKEEILKALDDDKIMEKVIWKITHNSEVSILTREMAKSIAKEIFNNNKKLTSVIVEKAVSFGLVDVKLVNGGENVGGN